ncbi:MASE3 domain-containing protein [Leptospira sp. GIMC2001]|uniref:MASE3 domain-containing protein n=1 Tax=Leptospira sp. GIMC2001 TaxID=1513297 RepID=UPI00234A2280|nr:MASE3 domain-containing protein [Leptospira sp. GIMC2001]WCL49784.1 histidine kinase [Leptospira sp. GIMC2001]
MHTVSSFARSKPVLFLIIFTVFFSFPIFCLILFPETFVFTLGSSEYLLFHNISEIFSVIVSLSIFGVGWYTYEQNHNKHDLFLAVSFLTIGLLDFMHALSYEGMSPFITPNSPNKSTQFWIVVRTYTALIFLISSRIIQKKSQLSFSKYWILGINIAFSFIIFIWITFFPQFFPDTYRYPEGLTRFKILSEYITVILLVFAFIFYYNKMLETDDLSIIYFLIAFIFSILSSMVFTTYSNVYDSYSMLGHVYKILSFYCIYQGIFVNSVNRPYSKLSRSNESLKAEISEHEQTESKLQGMILVKETLIRELYHRINNTLQVIKGMLVLQGNEYKDLKQIGELIEKTEDRIQAISFVHQLLYSTQNLSKISVREYFQKLSKYLFDSIDKEGKEISIVFNIQDLEILMDTAIPLGLIGNEMISQSLEYSFSKTKKGFIEIHFGIIDDKNYRFEYKDSGDVVLEKENLSDFKNSFGSKLIFMLGESQMKGSINLIEEKGIHWVIDFPMNIYQARV